MSNEKEDLRKHYAQRSDLSLEDFDRFFELVPCECGDQYCKGWKMKARQPLDVEEIARAKKR
jgi:hypothetical protein